MKRNFKTLLIAGLSLLSVSLFAQQVIRGRITDEITQTPIPGVSVSILTEGLSTMGAVSDVDGYFKIKAVPLGRHSLKFSMVGFEEQAMANVIVTAGKEVVINISLREQVQVLSAIEIVADPRMDKTATNNDLAPVSSRSFNVDDTKRYAGALGDPSRMAANFAGVIGGNDSRNDIVVRGNSPTGMLYQLEGLNIPNPNHFGSLNSTGGPVSMLNNNNLDKSDFLTSAFPSQYGNGIAGVFDIRLRDGNNEQHEFLGQVGFNGFEFGAEGPFSKSSKSSFIVNYRYSTLGLFQSLGIDFGTGSNTPIYQDLNFKLSVPSKRGKFTLFGMGGNSSIDLLGSDIERSVLEGENSDLYGDENADTRPRYATGVVGASYEINLSPKTFAKITAGFSGTNERFSSDSLVRDQELAVIGKYLRAQGELSTTKESLVLLTKTKIDSKNSITSGVYLDAIGFDLFNRDVYANVSRDTVRVNVSDRGTLLQAHTTWKHRFTNQLSLNAGLNYQYYTLNEQGVLQPRLSLQYQMNERQSLSVGYGLHSQIQSIYTTFVQTKTPSGYALSNRDLGFTKSNHYVITYDWNITEFVRLKAEGYYQSLSDIPVEVTPSSYSAINSGMSFVPDDRDNLVNEGTGENYGVELTLERFFDRGFYFLVTSSLFESTYKGSDGIARNTAFNTGYVANALGGKEFRVGRKRNYLSLNLKVTTIGGRYLTPIDLQSSGQLGRPVYQESEAFSQKQDAYFRTDFRVSYRKEYSKSTLEFALDLQNVTGNQNIFQQTYNPRTNSIATEYQQGFFPVPFVRYTF